MRSTKWLGLSLAAALFIALGCGGGGSKSVSIPGGQTAPPISARPLVTEGDVCTATIGTTPGSTYKWTVTGGTITSGADTSQVVYTAGQPGKLGLGCSVTSSAGVVAASAESTILPLPRIDSFTASPLTITAGDGAQLAATFINGTGNILPGNIAIQSDTPITVTPVVETFYTLNVTNAAGGNVAQVLAIRVVPAPTIASFTASASTINAGETVDLTPSFTGGIGYIEPGTKRVQSGVPIRFTPQVDTTYTLEVANSLGKVATRTLDVRVIPGTPVISAFTATPALVQKGGSTTFSATYSVGNGVITPGNLSIPSGGTVQLTNINATQTYTLTVTNSVGVSSTATTTVTLVQGNFAMTGSMANARGAHTATLLKNGKVLIAGDWTGSTSCEIYDSAVGIFTGTGTMNTSRRDHSATLLPNGQVLLVGGSSATGNGASAEVYDPGTGTFGMLIPMASGFSQHKALLLTNGQVLIVSSLGAQLFDPATRTFSPTGPMALVRQAHFGLTMLPNGKVLVSGGYVSSATSVSSSELYDPITGTFTATGSMGAPRWGHAATLLPSGKVLIAGGLNSLNGVGYALATAELYDPATESFSPTGTMSTQRMDSPTAELLPNGKVLIAGGGFGNSLAVETWFSCDVYDPSNGTFSVTSSLPTSMEGHTSILLPTGKALLAGGNDYHKFVAGAALYDSGNSSPFPTVIFAPSAFSFPVGFSIPEINPLGDGGTTWSVSPALPTGLSINPSTGIISGTPTAISPVQGYQVTGSNGTNSTAAFIWISVTL